MTRRQGVLLALGGGVILIAGFAIGFGLSSRQPEATPTPTPEVACQVSVSPTTISVDPDTGDSDDVLAFAGSGFPASSAVMIVFGPEGAALGYSSNEAGDFTAVVGAAASVTHPAPPDVEAGPVTWTVIGWEGPGPGLDAPSVPPSACEVELRATIELTDVPVATPAGGSPPTDLAPGGYAEVLYDGVRVRVEPALDSTVVGALFTGDVVRILAPAQVAEGLVWYRVESVVHHSGQQVRGYMAAGADGDVYLVATSEPPPPTPTPSPSPTPPPT
jgi:hypothetical protein